MLCRCKEIQKLRSCRKNEVIKTPYFYWTHKNVWSPAECKASFPVLPPVCHLILSFFSYGRKSHSLHIRRSRPSTARPVRPDLPPICHIQMSPRRAAPPLPFLAFALLSSHQLRKKKRKQLKFSSSTFAVHRGEGGGGGVSAAAYHVGGKGGKDKRVGGSSSEQVE